MLSILPVERSKKRARQTYDQLSPYYDFIAASEWPFIRAGLDLLAAQEGEQILEIGFGTGRALVPLAEAVGDKGSVSGIELAPKMRRRALARLKKHGLAARCQLELGDAAQLPYADKSFDAAFAAFTLELFASDEIPLVLVEIKRTLKKDGRALIVSLSKSRGASLPVRIYEFFHQRVPQYIDCRPIYLAASLREAGFAVEQCLVKSMWSLPVEIVLEKAN